MTKRPFLLAASLLVVAVAATSAAAHAEGAKAAGGGIWSSSRTHAGPAMTAMPPVRQQIKADAQQAGAWPKGTTLRLQYNASHTAVNASLWHMSVAGPPTYPHKPQVRMMMQATAKFKLVPSTVGTFAKPVKHYGETWMPAYRPFLARANAK